MLWYGPYLSGAERKAINLFEAFLPARRSVAYARWLPTSRPRPRLAPLLLPPTTSADHIFHFMCDSWGNIETLAALWLDEKYTLKEPAGCERAIRNCITVENVGKYCIMGVENCHPSARSLDSAKTVEYLFLMKTIYYSTWVGGNKDKPARWRSLITANPRFCFLIKNNKWGLHAYLPTSLIIYLCGNIVDIYYISKLSLYYGLSFREDEKKSYQVNVALTSEICGST